MDVTESSPEERQFQKDVYDKYVERRDFYGLEDPKAEEKARKDAVEHTLAIRNAGDPGDANISSDFGTGNHPAERDNEPAPSTPNNPDNEFEGIGVTGDPTYYGAGTDSNDTSDSNSNGSLGSTNDHQFGSGGGGGSDGGTAGEVGHPDHGTWPIVLDLDGDGAELVDISASTAFYDLNGDGFRTNLGWASADDGLLAFDKDSDGAIRDGDEISFVSYVEGAQTDLEGLVYFDSNSDGVLDSNDTDWAKFGVWRDLDQDGETDAGEFQSLDAQGITSITLSSDGVAEDVGSNHIFGRGSYTMTGGATAGVERVIAA